MSRALTCLAMLGAAAASSSTDLVMYLVDNFRELQPASPGGQTRVIYKSEAAGNCAAITFSGTSRKTDFPLEKGTDHHWTYADQESWDIYHDAESHAHSECGYPNTEYADSYPGESPIDVIADDATPTNASSVAIAGFSRPREGVLLANDGHAIALSVCAGSGWDCSATASFGTWPKTLRGVTSDASGHGDDDAADDHHRRLADDDGHAASSAKLSADTYYLKKVELHWGSANEQGSEHAVCGYSAAGEAHFIFVNRNPNVTHDRHDAASGTKYVIIGAMLEGGAEANNEAWAPLFEHLPHASGDVTTAGTLRLDALLPAAFDTKYYTYAGSLTTPPCSQQATWYLAQNAVALSDAQLSQLRDTTTPMHGHDTSYKALFFPFVAIVIGTATEHFLERRAPWVPYTVAVMVEGMALEWIASFGREGNVYPHHDSSMQESIDMWANIDGHLLLYAFLPALLFGDAVGLNVHMFQQSFSQCLLLACPGVLLGTFSTGLAAMYLLPYGWDWNLAMAFGSILAATDPVAVVALLKAVGASPKLTMQITGEALMNDGTAIVLFMLFMDFYNGVLRDPWQIATFFIQMAIGAPLIGVALGLLAFYWMSEASRKHNHSDVIVQTAITVCTAYLAFFLAESESGASGVLCTVAAALVLAKYMWPVVVSHDALENVWHAFEYFGNTLIFMLAGVITRRAMVTDNIRMQDYALCFVFYIIMTAIRGAMIVLFYPLLSRLGYGTTPKDAFFMVYGGLRGAVGLALAISVKSSISDTVNGDRVVFHISGLAFLTLIINGTTSGLVLKKLGMIGVPELKRAMTIKVRERVIAQAEADYSSACAHARTDAHDALRLLSSLQHLYDDHKAGRAILQKRLQERAHAGRALEPMALSEEQEHDLRATFDMIDVDGSGAVDVDEFYEAAILLKLDLSRDDADALMRQVDVDDSGTIDYEEFRSMFTGTREELRMEDMEDGDPRGSHDGESTHKGKTRKVIGFHSDAHGGGGHAPAETYDVAEIEALLTTLPPPNMEQVAMMRETMMQMVRAEYWEMIEEGHLPSKSGATLELLRSVEVMLDSTTEPLHDWEVLRPAAEFEEGEWVAWILEKMDEVLPDSVTWDNELHYLFNFSRQEDAFHICHSFVECHTKAQTKLAVFFGDDPSVDTAEEGTVILESLYQTERAQALLDTMSKTLVQHIKSMVVAQTVVEMQQSFVHKLIKQGVLTESDAEEFLEELRHNLVNIQRAKKERAAHMVKEAVKNDMLAQRPSRDHLSAAENGGNDLDLRLRRGSSASERDGRKNSILKTRSKSASIDLEAVMVQDDLAAGSIVTRVAGGDGDDREAGNDAPEGGVRDWWMRNQTAFGGAAASSAAPSSSSAAVAPIEFAEQPVETSRVAIAVEADGESFLPPPKLEDATLCAGCSGL